MTESEIIRARADLFDGLPENALVWIFGFSDPLHPGEEKSLIEGLEMFFEQWKAHGRPVVESCAVIEAHFLVVAATVPSADLTGCGIDGLQREVKRLAETADVRWASALDVFYRDACGGISCVPRPIFRRMVRDGQVTPETSVFDLSITSLGDLRGGKLERSAAQSWAARVFRIGE